MRDPGNRREIAPVKATPKKTQVVVKIALEASVSIRRRGANKLNSGP
jgi:hypothetical protein